MRLWIMKWTFKIFPNLNEDSIPSTNLTYHQKIYEMTITTRFSLVQVHVFVFSLSEASYANHGNQNVF